MNPYGHGPQPPVGAAPGNYAGGQGFGYGMPPAPYGQHGYALQPQHNAWLWHAGHLLCFRRDANLGSVCPKTNTETSASAPIRFAWVPQWVLFLVFVSPIIYVVVALALQKSATINMPLSPKLVARRKLRFLLPLAGFVLCVAAIVGGVVAGGEAVIPLAVLFGLIAFIGSLIAGTILGRPFKTHLVTRDVIVISGAHPDYLSRLPSGPVPLPD